MRGVRRGAPARLLALAACEARSPGCGRNSILRAAGQPIGGSAVPVGRSRGSAPCRRDPVLAALNLSPGTSGHRSTDHHKSYGGTVGLGDVSCTAQEGEIFAIPGPGGARQTATVGYIRGPGTPGSGRAGVPGLNPAGDRGEPRQRLGAQLGDSRCPGGPGWATCSGCTAGHRLARRSRHSPAGLVPDRCIGLDLIDRTHSCQGRGASLTYSSAP